MERNFNKPPEEPYDEAVGLGQAIEATERSIAEYKKDGADPSELEFHLKKLYEKMDEVETRIKKAA